MSRPTPTTLLRRSSSHTTPRTLSRPRRNTSTTRASPARCSGSCRPIRSAPIHWLAPPPVCWALWIRHRTTSATPTASGITSRATWARAAPARPPRLSPLQRPRRHRPRRLQAVEAALVLLRGMPLSHTSEDLRSHTVSSSSLSTTFIDFFSGGKLWTAAWWTQNDTPGGSGMSYHFFNPIRLSSPSSWCVELGRQLLNRNDTFFTMLYNLVSGTLGKNEYHIQ